jgi:large subunit ribosomal protein L25
MEEITLDAQLREEIGKSKVKDLREKGFVPAVVYGEGKSSLSIKVSHRQLIQLFHQHRLENAIISLNIKDDKKGKSRSCLMKEAQYHPVTSDIVHVDFNEISLTKIIKINVPVVAKGEPVGVKQEGGSLEHVLWEVEVECLPTDIPKEITVDVSELKMGDSIHIKDLTLPPKVKIVNSPDAMVLLVAAPVKEEVPVEAVEGEAASQEPEVIKEKKEVPVEGAEEEKEKEKEKK